MASDEPKHVKRMIFPSEVVRQGRAGVVRSSEPATPDGPDATDEPRLTLRIVNTAAADSPREMVSFRQSSVTIGRSRSCDLRLDDQKQVVSGKHAKIEVVGGRVQVTDLGSRNFTYLEGRQLEPDRPGELSPGATISIAEFSIQVEAEGDKELPLEAPTVFEDGYTNPFEKEAARWANLLERLDQLYEAEAPGRRDQALREAMENVLERSCSPALRQVLARSLDPSAQ